MGNPYSIRDAGSGTGSERGKAILQCTFSMEFHSFVLNTFIISHHLEALGNKYKDLYEFNPPKP